MDETEGLQHCSGPKEVEPDPTGMGQLLSNRRIKEDIQRNRSLDPKQVRPIRQVKPSQEIVEMVPL
jgi:hypothetical protein